MGEKIKWGVNDAVENSILALIRCTRTMQPSL